MPKGYSAHNQRAGRTFAERLAFRSVRAPNGCLLWTGAKLKAGYGVLAVDGVRKLAHRAAWEEENGPLPDGMKCCHRCDTPACIEIEHLFPGTQADNIADKIAKGRQARGEQCPAAKLTEAQAIEALTSIERASVLGPRLGVRPTEIIRIRAGERWAHLQPTAPAQHQDAA